ncbi:hypothetical protein OH77DRAFT_1439107, partial [Trametes cingulata]
MAPRKSYVNSFLEFAKATGTAESDDGPAPFCWAEWKETIIDEVVPWAKNATPVNCDLMQENIEAIQAFADGYYACKGNAATEAYLKAKKNAEGKRIMDDYIKRQWPIWGLNRIIDDILRENGITLSELALPDLTGVRSTPWVLLSVTDQLHQTYKIDETPVPSLYPDLASRLFGHEAFRAGTGILLPHVNKFVKGLVVTTFNRYRQKIWREGQALALDMDRWKKASKVFKQLQDDETTTPPVAAVKDYIRQIGA